jgi:transglutaminase/protease-like cytokinesis protein 3
MKKINYLSKKALVSVVVAATVTLLSAGSVFAANIDEVIKTGLDNKSTSINVSSQSVTPQAAMAAFHDVLLENPEYYYVNTSVNCSFSGTTAKELQVTYSSSADSAKMNAVVDSIVSEASKFSTDYEKAKYVHDYLATNANYDYTLSKFTAKDILVDKSGVCQAYASAYKLIMNKLGIECSYVQSQSMQHMWNVIKIDGKWYNVDCAWSNTTKFDDEPVGQAYFLKSNSYLIAIGYYDWSTINGAVCADMTYDGNL